MYFRILFSGWFRILEDETVPLGTISNVARVMPVSFLSSKKVPGFSLLDPFNVKDTMYEKLQYPPGVYYVHNIFEDYVKYNDNRNITKRKLLRCLVCMSEDDLEILFPFDVEGDFYIVEAKKVKSRTVLNDKMAYAYTLKQLVSMGAFTKPLVLQILKGQPPSKPCGFTGIIKVCDIIQERTIITVTLDGTRKLMELPVLPFPQFIRALNGKDLLESGTLRSDLLYMSGGAADKYAQEIKISVPLQQKDKQSASKPTEGSNYIQPFDEQASRSSPDQPRAKWTYVKPGGQSPRKSNEKQVNPKDELTYIKPLESRLPKQSTDRHSPVQLKDKHTTEQDIYIQPFGGQITLKSTDKSSQLQTKGVSKKTKAI